MTELNISPAASSESGPGEPGFDDLGLTAPLRKAVARAGYSTPTKIQRLAIPAALEGRDVVGCAQTGTGKTAAFSLPVLQHLDASAGDEPHVRALILTPTRELAAQIGESLATYGAELDLWHTVIFGGVKDKPQIRELKKGVDALVATPGRLLDLLGRGEIRLDRVEIFVLDEADRMLDMGFLPDVRRIVKALPKKRQNLLFSATMPPEIRSLADSFLDRPVSVNAAPVATPAEKIRQQLYFVDKGNKRNLLIELLSNKKAQKALVFSRTKRGANRIVKFLDGAGIGAAAIHGNKSQNARTRALTAFRDGNMPVLVATDIAARGIDVEGITHVINFDLPNEPETYVHRIGRTARAGASGLALSMCDHEERDYLVDIERLMGRHIERVDGHAHPPSEPPPGPTELQGRSRGKKSGTKRVSSHKKKSSSSSARRGSGRGPGRGGRGRRPGAQT